MSAPVTITNLIGHVVEPYKLVELIHSGSHGVVYRAVDMDAPSSSHGRDLRSDRAIKVVPKDGPVMGALEIGLHSLVSAHPNIITMEDAFEDDDYYFIILDLGLGGDLYTKIWDERAYHHNDELVRSTFLQIVDAVEACHSASVYHRDLKPENILCNEDGSEVYLCDFGMGRGRAISREFGCGTLGYMSPECLGDDLGRNPYSNIRHDTWALGVVLFNIITASDPWSKASTADEAFSDYLHNPTFFLDNFDISEGANTILRSIFVLNPMGRISLSDLRAAILGVSSFFRPDQSPNGAVDESGDIDDVVFSLAIMDEDNEESAVDVEELYIFPNSDHLCAPVKPFRQLLEMDVLSVDAAVRSFFADEDEDDIILPICSRSSSTSSIGSDDDSEDDSELPITPGSATAYDDVAIAEVNVYEGRFTEVLGKENDIASPKWTRSSSDKPALSPPSAAMAFSYVQMLDVV
ncbi:kinase-like domain-containing protein [Trametes gibbosa]|nr:kinase-like domain-containing protein [Trametes gibbosa]